MNLFKWIYHNVQSTVHSSQSQEPSGFQHLTAFPANDEASAHSIASEWRFRSSGGGVSGERNPFAFSCLYAHQDLPKVFTAIFAIKHVFFSDEPCQGRVERKSDTTASVATLLSFGVQWLSSATRFNPFHFVTATKAERSAVFVLDFHHAASFGCKKHFQSWRGRNDSGFLSETGLERWVFGLW